MQKKKNLSNFIEKKNEFLFFEPFWFNEHKNYDADIFSSDGAYYDAQKKENHSHPTDVSNWLVSSLAWLTSQTREPPFLSWLSIR